MPTLRSYSAMCDHVTEFGVRWVISTWALLAGKPSALVSYDINYHENIKHVERIAASNNVVFQFKLTNTINTTIDETDLLFIDTLHTYEQLKKELELHAGKVKKYIILHDTESFKHVGMDNKPKGLLNAMQEFLDTGKEWTVAGHHKENNGLTILSRL